MDTRVANFNRMVTAATGTLRTFATNTVNTLLDPIRSRMFTLETKFTSLSDRVGKSLLEIRNKIGLRVAPKITTLDLGFEDKKGAARSNPVNRTSSISEVLKTVKPGTGIVDTTKVTTEVIKPGTGAEATKPGTSSRASGYGAVRRNLQNVKANNMVKWLRRSFGSAFDAEGWAGKFLEKWGGKAVRGLGKSLTAVAVLALAWDILMANNKWGKQADAAKRGPTQGASLLWDAFDDDPEDVEYKKRLGAILTRFGIGFGAALIGAVLGAAVTSPLNAVPVIGTVSAGLITLATAGLFGLGGHLLGGYVARKLGMEPDNVMYGDDIDDVIRQQKIQEARESGQGMVGRYLNLNVTSKPNYKPRDRLGRVNKNASQTANVEESSSALADFFMPTAQAADEPLETSYDFNQSSTKKVAEKAASLYTSEPETPEPYQVGDVPTADLWDVPPALSMIPHPERSLGGGDLMSYGKNGGVRQTDVVITNYHDTNMSEQHSVSSVAQTSNVISLEKAPSYSPMRTRYAR